jgi:hypothetical protein
MSFHEPETAGAPDAVNQLAASKALKLRVACHYLLDVLDDECLPDIFESIKDNYEFYRNRFGYTGASSLRSGNGIKAEFGEARERTPFQIAQE